MLRFKLNLRTFIKMSSVGGGFALVSMMAASEVNNFNIPYVGGTIRFLRSLKIAALISLDYTFSSLGLNESLPNYKIMMSRVHQRSADRLLTGCLKNGGTYIKLGQGLACVNQIFPREYTETLKTLQDKCLKRKPDEVEKLFMQDFGKKPCEMYETFNTEAIAAASLAQVFRATTKDGIDVAVKVQYIDLRERFYSDIGTIEFLMGMIDAVHKDINFAWILENLKISLKEELDFIKEGKNSERCAKELQHLDFVYVPKVIWPLCSMRVLVTEFIDGYKISDVENLKRSGFSLADINYKMFTMFGEQIFNTGFVHADPHPGNVFVRHRNKKTELVLLDHGLYETVSEKDRVALSHMWKAIVLNDQKKMKQFSNELGVEDYQLFAEILTQMPLMLHNYKLVLAVTQEDIDHIQKFTQNKFEKVTSVLKSMPPTLLLIIRNLNTIRAIALDHGNPVDRYEVLARAATKRSFEGGPVFSRILNVPIKVCFELNILTHKLGVWIQRALIKLVGFVSKSSNMETWLRHIG